MSDCCPSKTPAPEAQDHCNSTPRRFDYFLWGSVFAIAVILGLKTLRIGGAPVDIMAHTVWDLLSTMWWGVGLGILFVGFMAKIPKEYFSAILGKGGSVNGLLRACLAGLFLDLCNHGILMVGAKLYERGVSVAQVMTFLIASPWNSLSLTFILIALIGFQWTMAFIVLSAVIAIITGLLFQLCEKRDILPRNPNHVDAPAGFSILTDAKMQLKEFRPSLSFFIGIFKDSRSEAAMLLRWLLFSVVLIALTRAFLPMDMFESMFGPTVLGLFATLGVATVLEICSEGSAPIASEFINSAHAPGNAFTFLMAGVSTDYTEILVLKDATKSWKIALFLPLLSVPQILLIGYAMNMAG